MAMIIAALDLSIRSTGFAVLDSTPEPNRGPVLAMGHAPARTAADVDAVVSGLLAFRPDVVAIEASYIAANAKTGIDLAVLRGRVLQLIEPLGIECVLVQPSQWRKTVFGSTGRQKRTELKALAKAHVGQEYGLIASEDECDAVCIAEHVANARN